MLGDTTVVATIAVTDIERAGRFYGDTLGLTRAPGGQPGVLEFRSGPTTLLVYQSRYAGTNRATAATWVVGRDAERVVRDLRAKGVAFEHYELPGLTRQGDLHVNGDFTAAWFKDPDGNILALVGG